jgi:hypothetical protein
MSYVICHMSYENSIKLTKLYVCMYIYVCVGGSRG